jgi:hypothetical protein
MDSEKKSDTFDGAKVIKGIFLISMIMTIIFVYFVAIPLKENKEIVTKKWNDLISKSESHKEIVTAYLECVKKPFGSSRSECQLVALNYGKARGFDNSQVVFNEIVDLSFKKL